MTTHPSAPTDQPTGTRRRRGTQGEPMSRLDQLSPTSTGAPRRTEEVAA